MARSKQEQNEINKAAADRVRREAGVKTREQIKDDLYLEFVTKAISVHGPRYDYSVPGVIGCHEHGPFKQSRPAHMRGQGCPECAMEARLASNRARAIEAASEFVSKAINVHSDLYSYDSTVYTNVHTKVQIECKEHGAFLQTPAAHLQGQGCPQCANERRAAFAESRGETAIAKWLEEHEVPYTKQKVFDGCRDRLPLRFDFYLPQHNTLIEFDGQQHFEFVKKFHGTVERFIEAQKRDDIKSEYAKQSGIQLLRIKYSEEKDIDNILNESIIV